MSAGAAGKGGWPVERAFVDDALVDAALAPAEAVATEAARVVESHEADPGSGLRALVHLFGRAGLLGLVAPQAHGGPMPAVRSAALCLVRERLGHVSPLADLAFAMQALGSHPIALRGGRALRDEWLPRVVRGDTVCAFALTEPDAGSDLGALATRARREGEDYVLDGHKVLISNAAVADLYTVFAVTDPEAPPKRRLSAFAVPADAAGLRATPTDVLGGHPIGEVVLDGVRLPQANRIGEEGDGLSAALGTLARLRPTVGAAAVGFAQRALDDTLAHVGGRKQFGVPLAELQMVQARLAEMACDVEAARLLVYRAAAVADEDAPRSRVAHTGSMAKLVATEAAQRVVDHAVQLHGGRGVVRSTAVARLYEDVRALRIYEGTNDVQKLLIARELLRER